MGFAEANQKAQGDENMLFAIFMLFLFLSLSLSLASSLPLYSPIHRNSRELFANYCKNSWLPHFTMYLKRYFWIDCFDVICFWSVPHVCMPERTNFIVFSSFVCELRQMHVYVFMCISLLLLICVAIRCNWRCIFSSSSLLHSLIRAMLVQHTDRTYTMTVKYEILFPLNSNLH